MASGDLNRIEDAFAEAVLDSGLWSRAFNRRRKFRNHRFSREPERFLDHCFLVTWRWSAPADVWSGWRTRRAAQCNRRGLALIDSTGRKT